MSSEEGNILLLHATYAGKAKAIQMRGFRIGPTTKRGTAVADVERKWGKCLTKVDCEREEAYKCSEALIEKVRREKYPNLPARRSAVFFYPFEANVYSEEPSAFKSEEADEWGRPYYDFGYGKDTLFVVDRTKVPCECGVGDNSQSDEVFKACLDGKSEEIQREEAEKFWKRAAVYNYKTFSPFKTTKDDEEERYLDNPEVWCPCATPRQAIVGKFDKNNPPPDRGITREDLTMWWNS